LRERKRVRKSMKAKRLSLRKSPKRGWQVREAAAAHGDEVRASQHMLPYMVLQWQIYLLDSDSNAAFETRRPDHNFQ